MSKLIRNLSSFISGRSDARTAPGAPEPSAAPDRGSPADSAQAELPLVPYAVTTEEMAVAPTLRRSRSVSLLRSTSNAMTTTAHAVPMQPPGAARPHPAATSSRPFLTQTERLRLQVMQAQIQLASLRLYEGPIDGVLSPATITSVRYFQTLKGLRPSGNLAAGTLSALGVPTLD